MSQPTPQTDPAALLLIYIDETDTWGTSRIPLYEAIVEKLFELGINGATVHIGIMGYGANRRLHRKRLFGVTDDRPVTISAVDTEERLRGALPAIRSMVKEGLVFLAPGEIVT
jgi:PII-like signaling protein